MSDFSYISQKLFARIILKLNKRSTAIQPLVPLKPIKLTWHHAPLIIHYKNNINIIYGEYYIKHSIYACSIDQLISC